MMRISKQGRPHDSCRMERRLQKVSGVRVSALMLILGHQGRESVSEILDWLTLRDVLHGFRFEDIEHSQGEQQCGPSRIRPPLPVMKCFFPGDGSLGRAVAACCAS